MKLNPSVLISAKVVTSLTLFLAPGKSLAGLERIEAGPQGASMSGRMMAAMDVQFGVSVSGTLQQRIEKLERELRLLHFTRDIFPALSKAITYAGTNVPVTQCIKELSRLAGQPIPMELGTNNFSAKEFVFRDLRLVDALKYLVAFDDAILDISGGKLVCRPVRQALAMDAVEYDLLRLMTSQKYTEVGRILAAKQPDVRQIFDQDRQSLLHLAAWHDQRSILSQLLDLGADVNAKSSTGYTPLHEAARFGNMACAELLLRRGADVSIADNNNDTPLETALYYGYRDVANLLAENGATLDIFTASGLGMVDRVRKLLDESGSSRWEHATGPKQRHSAFGGYGVTPLHCAARRGSVAVATLLIERGLSFSATDSQGNTPLHWAAAEGQLETVKFFIQKGSNVDATNLFGGTPLLVVVRNKVAPAVVNLLLQAGSNVNATDTGGENALHKLAWFGYPKENFKTAQMLLDAGANVSAKNHDGKTPLDILLDNKLRNEELVNLYREHGKKLR